jgi:hypothetical protein
MNSEDNIAEAFRKALMRQAYYDFLDWAWKKDEVMSEWCGYVNENPDTNKTFTIWVTETYWGDV